MASSVVMLHSGAHAGAVQEPTWVRWAWPPEGEDCLSPCGEDGWEVILFFPINQRYALLQSREIHAGLTPLLCLLASPTLLLTTYSSKCPGGPRGPMQHINRNYLLRDGEIRGQNHDAGLGQRQRLPILVQQHSRE